MELVELEFFNFATPDWGSADSKHARPGHIASFLEDNPRNKLVPLTDGMFGYRVTRPTINKDYFHAV
ncbi:hypothetical protein SLS58_009516 [Diplodia intermedia]|uniref:Uncharacterized protein n=1 Tax=Diplodia intermedia TaxID=856260 RepID=A0ABR3TBQ9_9PEZI